jgi:N-acetylglucosaminyldiphosphoundecaprenol N-acetyl-beta-D-mannosaminyltransferase
MLRKRQLVLQTKIDVLSWEAALQQLLVWARKRERRYACMCNVHSVVTAAYDREFQVILNRADLATPDGAPVAWAVRHFTGQPQARINGPDLMWKALAAAAQSGIAVYFYGGSPGTLSALAAVCQRDFPGLQIAGSAAPPFRPPTRDEELADIARINDSGAGLVFISLGCPKQERWMARNCALVAAPLIGVGAAFDYHAGTLRRAPLWWQQHGLEWLYRLGREPRRLAGRYLVGNSLFVLGLLRQMLFPGSVKQP